MLDFETARRRFLDAATLVGSENVPVRQALGRVLAEPIRPERQVPEFDTSAMDGYAVRVEDCEPAPFRLPVEGEAPAGAPPARLREGSAMRIFTGAAVPLGASAVVMQEHVTRDGEFITGTGKVASGQNIRRRGEDLEASTLALSQGDRLTAGALALVSFLDRASVMVAKSPRVTILCTGSELREPGSAARPGAIAESNSPVIEALTRQAAATVLGSSIVVDDAHALGVAIDQALGISDVLITIGGVSVGDYDYVRPALVSAGVSLELHQVSIKPGKPITLGHRQEKVVIGLPGNPASAVITFALFGVPLLRSMQGDKRAFPCPVSVPLVVSLKRDAKRTRVVLGNLTPSEKGVAFLPHPNQSSGATVALGQCEGFVIIAPGTDPIEPGASLPFCRWTDL